MSRDSAGSDTFSTGLPMLSFFKNFRRRDQTKKSVLFSRPLILLHSDDWGRVGVRDREGYESLRSQGIRLGQRPYDLYSLETAEDVSALADLLLKHRDSSGRPPCLMMYTCTANLDFGKMRAEGFRRILQLPLSQGLPGAWKRPGLVEAYKAGIGKGVFQPGLHGSIHLSEDAALTALRSSPDRGQLLRTFWNAETPYIHWRMPWVEFEYCMPEAKDGFLGLDRQRKLVRRAGDFFAQLFAVPPVSACAPGYRANADTHQAWSEAGVRVAVSGTADGLVAPQIDQYGLLHLHRNIDFEPSHRQLDLQKYIEFAAICFAQGIPLIVSIHSINFHSTLKDFRTPTLAALDELLSALESKYPELSYVNDGELYEIVTAAAGASKKIQVSMSQSSANRPLARGGTA